MESKASTFIKNINGCDPIDLDVGGSHMSVDRETLTKVNGSLLSATFSGNVELKKEPDSQRIFLDRDPNVFG